MRKSTRIVKRILALFLVVLMSINSFAAVVGDNDGAAFITKAEFDSLKNNFQSQIDQYNTSIDSKIDGAIASYLAGIKMAGQEKRTLEMAQISNDGYIYSLLTKDLGMTAGYADILINLAYNFGTKKYGGRRLAWRSGGFSVNLTKSSSSLDHYSNRLFYSEKNGKIIYDGYWAVNEYYSGDLGVNKLDYDAGFNKKAGDSTYGLYCWCSHNTVDGTTALNSWWSNIWTKWGSKSSGSSSWQTYYVVDFNNIKSVTTRKKNLFQALFLYDYDDTNQYPCWNFDALSEDVVEPSYNTQDGLNTRIVSNTLESIWDVSAKTQNWNQTGNDYDDTYSIFEQDTDILSSNAYPDCAGRSGFLNRNICVTKPEMKKVSTFLQNDLRSLEWTNSSEVKETLQGYSLSAGVPVTSVKSGDIVEWTPKIIKIEDGTIANIDIEFYYGVYNGSNSNRVLDVNKSTSTGKYTFDAKEGAMIFARWQNGYALELNNSTELYVTTN